MRVTAGCKRSTTDLRRYCTLANVALLYCVLQGQQINRLCRRFSVMPLTEDCGLIEWVPHTMGMRNCCTEVYTELGLYTGTSNPTLKKMYDTWTVGCAAAL